MKSDASFKQTHDVYGRAVYATVDDGTIVNYFLHGDRLVTITTNRRTTVETESTTAAPQSLTSATVQPVVATAPAAILR